MATVVESAERCVDCGSAQVTHRDDKTNEPLCKNCITFEKPPASAGLGLFERQMAAIIELANQPPASSPDTTELLIELPAALSLWLVQKATYSQHSQALGTAFRALLEDHARAAIELAKQDLTVFSIENRFDASDKLIAALSKVFFFIMNNWDMENNLTPVELDTLSARFQKMQLSQTRILRRMKKADNNDALLRAAMFGAALESAIAKIGTPELDPSTFLPDIEESADDSSSEEDDGGDYQ